MRYKLLHGDCLIKIKEMDDNSVHAIVTDPPYGLSFMGKKWDYEVPSVAIWREVLRVLKPGGHLLSFAGSRTYHRMAVNIEDAGFQIRDQIMWVYGSGFPKSQSISKNIDKKAGRYVEGEVLPSSRTVKGPLGFQMKEKTAENPQTDKAKEWEGWGTALKPAHEPILVARKPLIGTIVENVLEHGTGGINIDGCRVAVDPIADASQLRTMNRSKKEMENGWGMNQNSSDNPIVVSSQGRFPANFIHDGSDEAVDLLGDQSRFFYCAKASTQERNAGCENITPQKMGRNQSSLEGGKMLTGSGNERSNTKNNFHPTVKPVDLMRYLCRLVTPPNGVVLDPFMGSGTTGIAATQEGFNFIGIEMNDEYIKIANHRISHWVGGKEKLIIEQRKQKTLFDGWW
jgi:DNA modification methylase